MLDPDSSDFFRHIPEAQLRILAQQLRQQCTPFTGSPCCRCQPARALRFTPHRRRFSCDADYPPFPRHPGTNNASYIGD